MDIKLDEGMKLFLHDLIHEVRMPAFQIAYAEWQKQKAGQPNKTKCPT